MRVDVSYKYMEKSEFIEGVLDKDLGKLERHLLIFRRDDPIHISVHLEKNPHREQYFCRTQVYLPSRVLRSQAQASKETVAINSAFAALVKQAAKLKCKVERHLSRRRRTPDRGQDSEQVDG